MNTRFFEQLRQESPKILGWNALAVVSGFCVAYLVGQLIYRLTFHPLAKFPGPFLCRISYLQQCYYEAILNGKFLEKFPKYHQKYGTFS